MVMSVIQEQEIITEVKQGNEHSKQVLIDHHINMVYKYAHRYDRSYFNDMVQEGCIGLLHAADKFDFDKGARFSTYLSFWVTQSIDRGYIKHRRAVRLPSSITEELSRIRRLSKEYIMEHHIEPSIETLAELSGIDRTKIANYLQLEQETVSLDAELNDDAHFVDYLEDQAALSYQEELEKETLPHELEAAMTLLNEKEKAVLNLHFGLNGAAEKSLADISRIFDVTRERVRQIKDRALEKIRESMYAPMLQVHMN